MTLFSDKAWDDFFSDLFDSKVQQSTRYVASSGKNYVYDCRFCFVEYKSGNGGTICFQTSSTNAKLLVEKSSVLNCRASGEGGGIHFSSSGQCVLSKVCSFNCSSTGSDYQFDRVYVASNKECLNDINDSSISYSINNAYRFVTLHRSGTIRIVSTNYSFNNCKRDPVIHTQPTPDSSLATGLFSFSSFSNNTASSSSCIALGCYGTPIYQMNNCNIIKNKQSTSSACILLICGETTIKDASIMKNEGGYTIGIDQDSYKATLINCTFDYEKLSGTVVTKDSPSESFINKIKHIETDECVAIYDYVGTLSVIPDTPKRKKRSSICISFNAKVYNRLIFTQNYISIAFISCVLST